MADIFLSYAREDGERITVLVDWLEKQGWTVWWDRRIPPGKTFHEVIEEALNVARCVIVVWSKNSANSNWVINEAEEGLNRQILVPVLIDNTRPPLGFRRTQAANLSDWNGDPEHSEVESLFQAIQDIVNPGSVRPKTQRPDPQTTKPLGKRISEDRFRVGLIALLVVGGLVVVTILASQLSWRAINPNTNGPVSNVNANTGQASVNANTGQLSATPTVTSSPEIEVIVGKEIEIFNNRNTGTVENNPTNPTRFTIDNPYYITRVNNYHWNYEQGKDPTGKHLKLRDEKGQDFAQCEFSATSSAAGKTPNVNWICSPNVILPAGTYTVIDPDPQTWSHNRESGNAGFSLITGNPTRIR